ncbi:MAG: tRNA (N(6)-L-threonylcarbamoyladenosine(37)-C(2))-methylthiotransferase MtaB [Clostridia bacterium]|nr:tRNA (N(6)-L-threonylcarbamoyladenosine(37)-C(2))-methylthiotransferase MtaB [Clostridia bacterium]
MKISIITLGCKVNTCESESIAAKLKNLGHTVTNEFEKADAYIINTCAVTQEAEKKSRQCVARVRKYNAKAKIYVIGCASEKNPDQFDGKGVTYISGNAMKSLVAQFPEGKAIRELPTQYENMCYSENMLTRSFVKIQDGCNNFCTYCIVPYLRGRARSREPDDIYNECVQKSEATSEIVLTGINTSAYGVDLGITLTDLVVTLATVNARFRFSSLEVGIIDDVFLTAIKEAGNFCPHFHLSLQSGDDEVLKSMNRHYTRDEFIAKCDLIRQYFPEAAITTDIIVGFPTETDEAFGNTKRLVRRVNFADIHVFPYSRRQGTKASNMKLVEDSVVEARKADLLVLKRDMKREFVQNQLGKTLEVVAEYKDGSYAQGYSENYVRVYFTAQGEVRLGKKYYVKAEDLYSDGVRGVENPAYLR